MRSSSILRIAVFALLIVFIMMAIPCLAATKTAKPMAAKTVTAVKAPAAPTAKVVKPAVKPMAAPAAKPMAKKMAKKHAKHGVKCACKHKGMKHHKMMKHGKKMVKHGKKKMAMKAAK